MVSARQTLDHSSRNTIGHTNNIHRHHAQTIRPRSGARHLGDEHHRTLRDPPRPHERKRIGQSRPHVRYASSSFSQASLDGRTATLSKPRQPPARQQRGQHRTRRRAPSPSSRLRTYVVSRRGASDDKRPSTRSRPLHHRFGRRNRHRPTGGRMLASTSLPARPRRYRLSHSTQRAKARPSPQSPHWRGTHARVRRAAAVRHRSRSAAPLLKQQAPRDGQAASARLPLSAHSGGVGCLSEMAAVGAQRPRCR
jgi:hypothetical protein